eukprot:CFRG7874T1
MDAFKKSWFTELGTLWPGQAMSLEIEETLHDEKSDYQHVQVFKSKTYGNVLALDGVIQCTDRDEFSYQEMMAHVPLFTHPNPERVLIIGGGDGGVMREAVKHPSVKEVILCDIDKMVPDVSKKYFPNMAKGFDSPKSTLYIGDGIEFMRNHSNSFDIIITDSSDPVGPAEALFTDEYYRLMKSALRPGGIVCSQGECMWLHLELLQKMVAFNHNIYPSVGYGYVCIPTYPSGQIGLLMCSKADGVNFASPTREISQAQIDEWGLRYYNSNIHKAAFTLPEFARKVLQ